MAFPSAAVSSAGHRKNDPFKGIAFRTALLLGSAFFIVSVVITLGTLATIYQAEAHSRLTLLAEKQKETIARVKVPILSELKDIVSDLEFLAGSSHLQTFLTHPADHRAPLADEWTRFRSAKKIYEKISFFDVNGQELLRISDDALKLKTDAAPDMLANTLALERGEIFLSPLDFHTEQGQIIRPLNPLLRLSTPVAGADGRTRGILQLHVRAARLLDRIQPETMMLLNRDGYWLKGGPPADQSPFIAGPRHTFAALYPEAWWLIQDAEQGQFQTANGLFTFTTIYPLRDALARRADAAPTPNFSDPETQYFWKLVSHIRAPAVEAGLAPLRHIFRTLFISLTLFLLFVTILLTRALFRHQLAEKSLEHERNLLQTLADALPAPVFYKDTRLRYIGCNRAFEAFSRHKRRELIGRFSSEFFPQERALRIHALDQKFLASPDAQISYETQQPDGEGHLRDYLVTKSKFYHQGGALGGFVAVLFDITPHKILEHDLSRAKEKTEQLYQDLLRTHQQLAHQNEQITDGIEYASRIQNSMLLDPEEILEHFRDGFILLRPKDALSGDFYWFAQKDELLFIAAADCTGHGVPGALMTVLSNELLNQIVYEQRLTQPDHILRALDLQLKISLQKKRPEDEVHDGMDIALCVLDLQNRQLQFAGAKNSLCYLQNGALQHIKGARVSVGGKPARPEKTFPLHTQTIQPGDTFYLFTDGFQDQLNPDHEKFMTKRLLQTLADIHTLPLHEQKQRIQKTLERWKQSQIQTDDILLIGIQPI